MKTASQNIHGVGSFGQTQLLQQAPCDWEPEKNVVIIGVLGLVAVAPGVSAQSFEDDLRASGLVIAEKARAHSAKASELPKPDFTKADTYTVDRVIDGDTIAVSNASGLYRVRLIGIDTPETVHPSKPVQYYGKEASRFTKNLLKGEKVFLLYEGTTPTKDKYGRLLAYVYRAPDGLFVNAEIIRQGYGHAYTTYPFKHLEKFRQIERFARAAGKGLWGTKEVEAKATAAPKYQARPRTVKAPAVKSVPAKPPAKRETAEVTVYVTRTGKKYHRGSCSYLRRSKIPMPLSAAKAGYGPCSRCGPP